MWRKLTALRRIYPKSALGAVEAPRFEFVARQRIGRRLLKADANAELAAEACEQGAGGFGKRRGVCGLQANQQVIHAGDTVDADFVFDDFGQAADQVINGAWIKIDA